MSRKGFAEHSLTAKKIISESQYGHTIAESFGIDAFVTIVISTLQDKSDSNHYFRCFEPSEFFGVLMEAVERINVYDGTPATLHLYLGNDNPFIDDLRLPSGQPLDEIQLRFLFLQILRWFSEFPMADELKGGFGTYSTEWKESLESCDGSQDDIEALKHLWVGAEKNLTRLIHPILEINDFDYLKRQLHLMPNNRKRLEFAIEILAHYEQTVGDEEDTYIDEYGLKRNGFAKNLRIEIEKLEKLIKLDDAERTSSDKRPDATANRTYDDENELTKQEKRLVSICPLFRDATPHTQRTVWELMLKFTRKQWAYFADVTNILRNSTDLERARNLEEISGLTNLRTLFGKQPNATDRSRVSKVITLLKADRIKTQNA